MQRAPSSHIDKTFQTLRPSLPCLFAFLVTEGTRYAERAILAAVLGGGRRRSVAAKGSVRGGGRLRAHPNLCKATTTATALEEGGEAAAARNRYYNKQKELSEQMQGSFCPKIRKKVLKNAEYANMCYASPAGQGIFQVQVKEFQYIVDIQAKHCDCRRWDLTGIPCSHAISCLRHERIPPESVLPMCYSTDAFSRAYGGNIWPCSDKSLWEKVNGPEILPPVYEKKVGRPPKSRRKQPYEVQGKNGTKLSKHGVIIHCKHCGAANHNSGGCQLKKDGISSEDAKRMVSATQQEQPMATEPLNVQQEQPMTTEPLNVTIQNVQDQDLYGSQLMSQLSSSQLSLMMQEEPQPSMVSLPTGPLPDSDFIMTNRPIARPAPLTTYTKKGRTATTKKRKATKDTGATCSKRKATSKPGST
ncbi:unnamed protein product [Urochloa humidicola]